MSVINKNSNILIVGLGLIGGSYAQGLSDAGFNVTAIDINKDTLDYALEKKIISNGYLEANKESIGNADIIIFGLYPSEISNWYQKNFRYIKEGALLLDVAGVKCSFIYEIQNLLRPDLEFIGTHPMAGREVYGVRNSNKNLFVGANLIITPTNKNTQKAIDTIKEIGNILRFKNIECLTPEEHDDMIGFLSQLTHIIAISLMTSKECTHFNKFTGDSFRDLTRIARINENMWSELFIENKDVLINQIDIFTKQMDNIKQALIDNDEEKLKEIMRLSTSRRAYFDK